MHACVRLEGDGGEHVAGWLKKTWFVGPVAGWLGGLVGWGF
jgi:hypothetical protein